jgi:hypothetical protein
MPPAPKDFGYGGPFPGLEPRDRALDYRVVRSRTRGGHCLTVDVVGMTASQARRLEARFLEWLIAEWPSAEGA